MGEELRAPYAYIGSKRYIAPLVWQKLGKVDIYIEPFFGSGAIMLSNPYEPLPKYEVVNDLNCYIANFWRATKIAPHEVAYYADWPVNENDLHARHKWLWSQYEDVRSKMESDPEYCDTKVAGLWVWGLSAWIMSGWCTGWLHRQRPKIAGGQGIHRGIMDAEQRTAWLLDYMQNLSNRLRNVQVLCGDWERVFPDYLLRHDKPVGIFLDPPYLHTTDDGKTRDDRCYGLEDDAEVAIRVRDWCIKNGENPNLRIILCGYEGEHELPGWEKIAWKAPGGQANTAKRHSQAKENASRERLWCSVGCAVASRRKQLTFI